jgi:tetratricopeptide (TPR) repeat protein
MASQDKVGEARIWYQLASNTIARIGRDSLFEQRRLQVEGLVAAASGDIKAATEAQLKALAAAERAIGPNNPALWPDLEVIAVTLGKAGAWDKALPYFERAMALREASVGPDHPDIAVILTNLGAAYSHAGDTVKSKAAYERAVAIRERTDGPQSPMLILTLNNMSDGMVKAGDPAGALYYADRATQLAIKLVGKPNPLYHAIATTRAEALVAGGKLDEARKQYDEVLALEVKTQSAYLGPTLSSRANLELGASKWADAVTFEQRAIAAVEATGGKTSPDLWQPLTGLAQANIRLKRPASVTRPLLERAIAIGEKAQIAERDLKLARTLLKELGPS